MGGDSTHIQQDKNTKVSLSMMTFKAMGDIILWVEPNIKAIGAAEWNMAWEY